RPAVQFIMIGTIETDISSFSDVPNVHFLGRQPYAELPLFLAGLNATMSLFRVDDPVAESVNPVKIYEYLAADKEVLATPIPESKKLGDRLWLVPDGNAAAAALDRILAGERKVSDAAARREFAASNTWSARVDEIERVLYSVLPAAERSAEHAAPAESSLR
ncbi:MAG: hypothetical protein K6T83_18720, partial [Alicyclobacillus sp.]|nr:hypothetical protein [Alicyclobacillus sp.]